MTAGSRRGQRLPPAAGASVVLGAAFLTLASAGCTRPAQPDRDQAPAEETARLEMVEIPVEGMSCAVCASRVRKALTSIGGVTNAEVSLVERRARVRFDPGRVSPDDLVTVIEGLGYRAGPPEGLR